MDYLIVAYLTIISRWPISLPVVAAIAWLAWSRNRKVTGFLFAALFVVIAIAAWQFERYIN